MGSIRGWYDYYSTTTTTTTTSKGGIFHPSIYLSIYLLSIYPTRYSYNDVRHSSS